jgi:ribosomal protein S27AE
LSKSDGLRPYCKTCERKHKQDKTYYKRYYDENRDRIYAKNAAWHEKNRQYANEKTRLWHKTHGKENYRKNKLKIRARIELYYAVKKGIIQKPLDCSQCGHSGYIEAHHTDYKKPLDVIWLCKKCHNKTRRVLSSSGS